MIIKNTTRQTRLATDLARVTSVIDQLLGLLRKSNSRSLLLNTRFGIHTFGLTAPIDVIILDDQLTVRKLCLMLKPNRILLWNPKFQLIVELPANTIINSKTKLNDQLSIT